MPANPYAKFVVALVGAVVTVLLATFPDDPNVQQWGTIVATLLTALGVYSVPNKDRQGRHQRESVQPPSA